MKDILDYQINEYEEKFNLQKEIRNKIKLLQDFAIYPAYIPEIIEQLNKCETQQQLDNVMRQVFIKYL